MQWQKATKWRKEVIIAIGNTLSTLPNTRELYRHKEITEEEGEHNEDPVGFNAVGIGDAQPVDDRAEEGIFELGETSKPELQPEGKHEWLWLGQQWQCVKCLRCSNNKTGKHPCEGVPEGIRAVLLDAGVNNHKLAGAWDDHGSYCLWCCKCGAWGSCRMEKLGKKCMPATRQGNAVLRRIQRGQHPDGVRRLGGTGN